MKRLVSIFLCASLLSSQVWGATNPTLPQSVPSGTRPTPTGSVINVHSGDDLQHIYDTASCGQDLVLDEGAVFSGSYVFNKQCSAPDWILVEGAGCADGSVSIPTYVTQASANYASVPPWPVPALTHYATITNSATGSPILTTDPSNVPAKYNYFGCLEVTSSAYQYQLIGVSDSLFETLASQMGDHLMFDRMYVHGLPAQSTVQMRRGFLVTGSNISVVNSYVSQIYDSGSDAQAILGAFGPGPYLIQNNFLSASTEPILFGGTGPTPSYSCTIAASPAPTPMTATVSACIDGAGNSAATPAVGTQVMFLTSVGVPAYLPTDWTTITGNNAGTLTFNAIHAAPMTGAANVVWGLLPDDITIAKNFIYKPPSWNPSDPSYDGIPRGSKVLFEVKYGRRWNVTGNIMENTWFNGQQFAFNINASDQNGGCPWCTSSDISVTNNIFKNISGAFQTITAQNPVTGVCPAAVARVLIQNNLFFAAGAAPYIAGGSIFELAGYAFCSVTGAGIDSLQIVHNNLLGAGINMVVAGGTPYNYTNLVIRDNLTEFDQYRWSEPTPCADSTPPYQDGASCIRGDVSSGGAFSISNNAIINSGAINGNQGVSDATIISRYGSMVLPTLYDANLANNYSGVPFVNYAAVNTDYHNFALTGNGPWRKAASDGTDPGVNLANLDADIPVSTTPNLPPIDLSGINGKTFNVSDDLSFPLFRHRSEFYLDFPGDRRASIL